jgi:hypothetical protein
MRRVSGASASASAAEEHFVLAEAHRQRRAVLRADHQLGWPAKIMASA